MKLSPGRALLLALAPLLITACGDDDGASPGQPLNVSLTFKPRVDTLPFACGQTYTGVGSSKTTYEPKDFRLYVHDVRLVSEGGEEVPVELTDDGAWQQDGVVMLDFENKTGLCTNGTEAMNDRIVGTAPAGHYSGLRFKVGVPFEQNHQDASTARAPLNVSTLFWGWAGGYKFIRLDARTAGLPNGHNFHLGSTLCQTSGPNQVTSCENPNRFEVSLPGYDPAQPKDVVVNIARLFALTDLNANQAQTAPGCMSDAADGDCESIFSRLGLPFAGKPANPANQSLFYMEE